MFIRLNYGSYIIISWYRGEDSGLLRGVKLQRACNELGSAIVKFELAAGFLRGARASSAIYT